MDQFFKDLESKGWEFEFYKDKESFRFKSPRMKFFRLYNKYCGSLGDFEVGAALNEKRNIIKRHCEDLENDILRQFEILLRRNQDLPTELDATMTLKFD